MKKPDSFKAGFYNWTIVWSEEEVDSCFGKTDAGTKTIIIYKQGNDQVEKETLLHELLHVALDDKCESIFNVEGSVNDKEENLIRLLSPVIMQIICDNRQLCHFLFGRTNERRGKVN